MRYGDWFSLREIPGDLIRALEAHVRTKALETAITLDPNGVTRRSSKVSWIKDSALILRFLEIARVVNREAGWDFDIDVLEPLQYTEYSGGDEYGWHCDQHRTPYPDGRVRKISFSVFLNDGFEGGEFDLELHAPNLAERCATFAKAKPNTALYFQSDLWHRVRPVSNGVRKSLVGWVLGKRFR